MDTGDAIRRIRALEKDVDRLRKENADQIAFNQQINRQLNQLTAAHNEVAKIIMVAAKKQEEKKILTLN
jgi:hypothetical protein